MVWPDKKYEIEVSDPLGRKREPDSVSFNADLFNWYKNLISLRNENKALSRGDLNFFLVNNGEHIIGYSRTLGNERIIVVVNNSGDRKSVVATMPGGAGNTFVNLLDGRKINCVSNTSIIELQPYEIVILR
jgi:glycosidase